MSRRMGWSLALPIALMAAAVLSTPALAAYPGVNGKIYFQACAEGCAEFDVYAVNPDGSGLENLTDVVTDLPGLPNDAFEPSVSADGKRVVFGVDTQAESEIWIINADGSDQLQLTDDNLLNQQPAISPDGTRIAWNQWSPFPTYTDRDIWSMNSNGSGQELLFNGSAEDYFPQFTPDGLTLVMASETGDMDIRKILIPAVPPATSSIGVAEDDALLESDPSVSPDGARVAFTQTPLAKPGGPFDIYSVGINGGPTTPVFNAAVTSEAFPAYSPDGTKIVFGRDELPMIGNADGSGTPVPLDVGTLGSVRNFDWAPMPAVAPLSSPPAGVADTPAVIKPTRAPNGRIGKHPPKRTTKRTARFTFSSDQPASSFECKLDGKPFRRCASPFVRKVKLGRHAFRLRAVSGAGLPDPSATIFRWRVLAG